MYILVNTYSRQFDTVDIVKQHSKLGLASGYLVI